MVRVLTLPVACQPSSSPGSNGKAVRLWWSPDYSSPDINPSATTSNIAATIRWTAGMVTFFR